MTSRLHTQFPPTMKTRRHETLPAVKFSHRRRRNKFYSNRPKLVRKKAKDLPKFNLSSETDVFVAESITSFKKKHFAEVNKVKQKLKWNYIWTYKARIFLRHDENRPSFSFNCKEDLSKFKIELARSIFRRKVHKVEHFMVIQKIIFNVRLSIFTFRSLVIDSY